MLDVTMIAQFALFVAVAHGKAIDPMLKVRPTTKANLDNTTLGGPTLLNLPFFPRLEIPKWTQVMKDGELPRSWVQKDGRFNPLQLRFNAPEQKKNNGIKKALAQVATAAGMGMVAGAAGASVAENVHSIGELEAAKDAMLSPETLAAAREAALKAVGSVEASEVATVSSAAVAGGLAAMDGRMNKYERPKSQAPSSINSSPAEPIFQAKPNLAEMERSVQELEEKEWYMRQQLMDIEQQRERMERKLEAAKEETFASPVQELIAQVPTQTSGHSTSVVNGVALMGLFTGFGVAFLMVHRRRNGLTAAKVPLVADYV